jgi:hypothetical protein
VSKEEDFALDGSARRRSKLPSAEKVYDAYLKHLKDVFVHVTAYPGVGSAIHKVKCEEQVSATHSLVVTVAVDPYICIVDIILAVTETINDGKAVKIPVLNMDIPGSKDTIKNNMSLICSAVQAVRTVYG